MIAASLLTFMALCLIAQTQFLFVSAFQSTLPVSKTLHKTTRVAKLDLVPEIQDSVQQLSSALPIEAVSIPVSSDAESWRQYVPLVVTGAVIIDILLGNPLANLVLGPMKRASEKGATGDDDGSGGPVFSGSFESSRDGVDRSRGNERVDSNAIAQAAYDKAKNTLELKRFLEENQTDEQRYEEIRKKMDRQMEED